MGLNNPGSCRIALPLLRTLVCNVGCCLGSVVQHALILAMMPGILSVSLSTWLSLPTPVCLLVSARRIPVFACAVTGVQAA